MKTTITIMGLFVLLSSLTMAEITVNETFENNSLVQWSAGNIESANPLSGSYSIRHNRPTVDHDFNGRPVGTLGSNSEAFNISFAMRWNTVADWVLFGVADVQQNATAPSNAVLLSMGSSCGGGSDSSICYNDGSYNDTGLDCNEKTTGSGCNITLGLNATASGSSADTVFWITVNGTTAGPFGTRGSLPITAADYFGGGSTTTDDNIFFDDITIFNSSTPFGNTIPVISAVNCTSCNIPFGDNSSPYTTSDTTPTFTFSTDIGADCRIADEDVNHTTMGASRDCTSGQGVINHTCTLTVPDELVFSQDDVYIGCASSLNGNETSNSSAHLIMDITNLAANSSNAIDNGIRSSVIWPGATTHSDQQVYLRNLSNSQVLATVDRVAVYGNQRWILNVRDENEGSLGLFNITPVVYVLDVVNLSFSEIQTMVSSLINATRS